MATVAKVSLQRWLRCGRVGVKARPVVSESGTGDVCRCHSENGAVIAPGIAAAAVIVAVRCGCEQMMWYRGERSRSRAGSDSEASERHVSGTLLAVKLVSDLEVCAWTPGETATTFIGAHAGGYIPPLFLPRMMPCANGLDPVSCQCSCAGSAAACHRIQIIACTQPSKLPVQRLSLLTRRAEVDKPSLLIGHLMSNKLTCPYTSTYFK